MSFYNVAPTTFDADKLDAIVKLASIDMLDRKTAIALLGGNAHEVKPTVITRHAEILPTPGEIRHAAATRKAAKTKVTRKDVKVPVHASPAPTKVVKGADMAPNWSGQMMPCAAGSASKGQCKWLVANAGLTAKQAAKLSMVDASNLRAKLTGKLA